MFRKLNLQSMVVALLVIFLSSLMFLGARPMAFADSDDGGYTGGGGGGEDEREDASSEDSNRSREKCLPPGVEPSYETSKKMPVCGKNISTEQQ